MSTAQKSVSSNGATAEWLDEAGQYYAEFENKTDSIRFG
jgi:hypothetical protein